MDTLSQATESLKNQGYTINFSAEETKIIDPESEKTYSAEDIYVKAIHRFEGMSNPGDMSILYALETKDGHKGLLIDAYGTYGQGISVELAKKLNE
jgi:protease II